MAAPERGDIVWISFSPQAGQEQAGRRPALVLSPRAYHQQTDFAVVCPITTTIKGYPFEVILPDGLSVHGAVLTDQIKSVDRHARKFEIAGKVPTSVIDAVLGKVEALLVG